MAGTRLTLPTTFTDRSLPILRADELLPAAGALYLFDASHTAGAWPAGRTSGMALPNLAAEQALALTGSELGGTLDYAGTDVKISRSTKGGVHIEQTTQAAPIPAGNYAKITMPSDLAAYIRQNRDHSYYLSQWTRSTRGNKVAVGAPYFTASIAENSTSYLGSLYRNNNVLGNYPNANNGGDQLLGGRGAGTVMQDGAPNFQNVATAGWIGGPPAAPSDINVAPLMYGRVGRVVATSPWPALIVYRCYLEDLTVSGRSYAEADAADAALYNREVMTAGGRYYNDTYTAPII